MFPRHLIIGQMRLEELEKRPGAKTITPTNSPQINYVYWHICPRTGQWKPESRSEKGLRRSATIAAYLPLITRYNSDFEAVVRKIRSDCVFRRNN